MKTIALLPCLLIAPLTTHAQTDGPAKASMVFEEPAVLSASAVFGEAAVGAEYRVREQIPTDGYMAHVTIDSDYGRFDCIGVEQAKDRMNEIAAIGKLVAVSRTDLFAKGVKQSIEAPIDAVKNIAADPVGSIKAAPKTVGHFFRKVGRGVQKTAESVGRNIEAHDTAGLAKDGSRTAKSIIGFDKAKLDCAKQLGVDPYSDNKRLQEEIQEVSWVFFSGGLPLRLGAMAVSGGASLALSTTNAIGLPEEMYALTPGELGLRNQEALKALGSDPALIAAFETSPACSITVRRKLILALDSLGNPPGSLEIIRLATELEQSRQTAFLLDSLELLNARNIQLAKLEVIGRLPAAIDNTGVLVIPAPVDFISWTPEIAEFAQRDDLAGRKPVMLAAGQLSPASQTGFAAAGWTIRAD